MPKEIRRTLRIRDGDPLEIFTDREGEIILKKYSPIGELGQFAGLYAESLAQTSGCLVCITDKDHVIAAAGTGKKEFDGKPISKQLEHVITDRETFCAQKDEKGFVKITLDDAGDFQSQVVSTIICEGDAIGSVVMYNREEGATGRPIGLPFAIISYVCNRETIQCWKPCGTAQARHIDLRNGIRILPRRGISARREGRPA